MRDGSAAKDDSLAPSWANSASTRRVEGLRPPKAFSWRRYAIARVRNDRLISRDGAFPNIAFQRSRSSSMPSFDRLAISEARVSRPEPVASWSFLSTLLGFQLGFKTHVCSSLRRAICCPNDTHTLLDSRH